MFVPLSVYTWVNLYGQFIHLNFVQLKCSMLKCSHWKEWVNLIYSISSAASGTCESCFDEKFYGQRGKMHLSGSVLCKLIKRRPFEGSIDCHESKKSDKVDNWTKKHLSNATCKFSVTSKLVCSNFCGLSFPSTDILPWPLSANVLQKQVEFCFFFIFIRVQFSSVSRVSSISLVCGNFFSFWANVFFGSRTSGRGSARRRGNRKSEICLIWYFMTN